MEMPPQAPRSRAGATAMTALIRACFIAAALWTAGCAAGGSASASRAGSAYPASAPRLHLLDAQVIPDGRTIRLTNTTPAPLGPGRLWLNQWYSAAIDAIAVGATVSMPLSTFRDEHGDPLPGGGFFAVQAPEPIVDAEVETDKGLAALVVVAPRR